ncbi:MAG: sugar-transfer associated ATP-grasp domain-containing protein [Pseudomonadota bacterium]
MSDASLNGGALLDAPGQAKAAQAPVIVQVAKAFGVSPLRQMRESWSMRGGAQKLGSNEYYSLRLFHPEMPVAEKRAFAGQKGINALNARLNPPKAVPTRAFVGNKLLYTQLLSQLGLDTAETQALVSTHRNAGSLSVLRDARALIAFLQHDARFPIFGKPHHGSLSEGSVRINGCSDGQVHLANGTSRSVIDFADEVMTRYPGGFILQTAIEPHPHMAEVAGPAVGCVRVVTVNDGSGPEVAYTCWKLPAPKAMSDNFWQDGSLLAALDKDSGTVQRVTMGMGIAMAEVTTHPVSHRDLVGLRLPHWDATLKLACDTHAVFPEFGICGFDIAVAPDGPKIIECNDNPSHNLYQIAARRGVLSPELSAIWDRVAERQAKQMARLNGK